LCRRNEEEKQKHQETGSQDAEVNLMAKLSGEQLRKFTCEHILEYLEMFMTSKRCFEMSTFLEYISGKRTLPNIARMNLKRMYSRSNFNALWIKSRLIKFDVRNLRINSRGLEPQCCLVMRSPVISILALTTQ
jgi:hypothetical protein